MNYEQLLTAADQEGLLVKEQPLTEHDGSIRGSTHSNPKGYRSTSRKSVCLPKKSGIIAPAPETF